MNFIWIFLVKFTLKQLRHAVASARSANLSMPAAELHASKPPQTAAIDLVPAWLASLPAAYALCA
jgi:hypothetical protein